MLAGDAGSEWTSGLRLGLREWKLLLPDSLVESEPVESELECLTRLPCVCARCADRLSVNMHTNIREGSEGVHGQIYCCLHCLTHSYRHTEDKWKPSRSDFHSEGFVSRYLCLSQEVDSWIACETKHTNLLLLTLPEKNASFKRRSQDFFPSSNHSQYPLIMSTSGQNYRHRSDQKYEKMTVTYPGSFLIVTAQLQVIGKHSVNQQIGNHKVKHQPGTREPDFTAHTWFDVIHFESVCLSGAFYIFNTSKWCCSSFLKW